MKIGLYFQADRELAEECRRITGAEVEILPAGSTEVEVVQRQPVIGKETRIVQTLSAGVDHLDFKAIPHNIVVLSNAGAYSDTVAAHALALLLAAVRKIIKFDSEIRNGQWNQTGADQIRGKTVGILGYGGIGKAFADLTRAMGANITAYSRSPVTDGNVKVVETLEELFSKSYVVLIAVPLTKSTRGLVGRSLLDSFQGRYIINVARSDIVDRNSMMEYLERNPEKYYLSDVWWGEPRITAPIPQNVILTPHVAGMISEQYYSLYAREYVLKAFENLGRYLKGEKSHVVNQDDYR